MSDDSCFGMCCDHMIRKGCVCVRVVRGKYGQGYRCSTQISKVFVRRKILFLQCRQSNCLLTLWPPLIGVNSLRVVKQQQGCTYKHAQLLGHLQRRL